MLRAGETKSGRHPALFAERAHQLDGPRAIGDFIVSSIGAAHLKDKAGTSNAEVAAHIRDLLPNLEQYHLQLVFENHAEHAPGQIIKQIIDLLGVPPFLCEAFKGVIVIGAVLLQKKETNS